MRIKLIANGSESPQDFRLLKTTISTVAILRKTAVLRFNSERLSIISTPKSASNISNTILYGDNGQLWCSIPRDVFKQYTVISKRELSAITMECNCDLLLSALKRYEKVISQGCSFSEMVIKLQSLTEANTAAQGDGKSNPVCALGISFEEVIHTVDKGDCTNENTFDNKKTVTHYFKVPVRLMPGVQDARIKEPMVSGAELSMYKLPPFSSEFGAGFSNFIRRVDRYSNANHIRLSAVSKRDALDHETNRLKLVINSLDWHLEVCWNGPLTPLETEDNKAPPETQGDVITTEDTEDSMRIDENTSMLGTDHRNNSNSMSTSLSENDVQLMDVSAVVERAERERAQTHEVMIRIKDWKVCHKLYDAFEEIILAISHNESCVFHCSLDRGNVDEGEDPDRPKEKGQIIYYMARSKSL